MKAQFAKIKHFFKKISCWIPTALPVGMTEFDNWANTIVEVYGLPDNDSVRFALATMILHLDSASAYKPKRYFGLCALKSMSNQIAAGVMQDLKEKQKAAEAAAAAPKPEGAA